jgi:hypothetical protein
MAIRRRKSAGRRVRKGRLLMTGFVSSCGLPPFPQKKAERMGHGSFVVRPDVMNRRDAATTASRAAQDDEGGIIYAGLNNCLRR